VAANARLSLVLSAVQKDCVLGPVSPGEVHLRHLRIGGLFLQGLRQLEHLPNGELALQ